MNTNEAIDRNKELNWYKLRKRLRSSILLKAFDCEYKKLFYR